MKCAPFIAMLLIFASSLAFGQTTRPVIHLASDIEDGKKMLHASVELNGKPLENITLQYFIHRTFGNMLVGEDTTLDDGTSAVNFPTDLPGEPDGQIHALVRIKAPRQYESLSSSMAFPSDLKIAPTYDAFPRALWAPHAPMALMATIFVLVVAVWLSYLFVVTQIFAIRKGGT